MSLEAEIEKAQRQVRTDSYPMSVGEIVNMYEANELIIRPPFQRLFRWELNQKSKLVESILLGIPVPPIFVFETSDGTWELIDGLQRLSTILEFMGLLRQEGGAKFKPPSCLEGTRYLPSLRNVVWDISASIDDVPVTDQHALPKSQQFFFKRSKLNVQILKRPSDAETKYDLFQRLNRGGTVANAQEIRNCVVIMINQDFFDRVAALAGDTNFQNVSRITDRGEQTQRPLEMVMRFLVFLHFDYDGVLDVEEFVDDRVIKLAEAPPPSQALDDKFNRTFALLNAALGDQALQKWDDENQRFTGRVGQVALEVVAVGIARNLPYIDSLPNQGQFLVERIQEFWQQPEAQQFTASGLRGTQRLRDTILFGQNWFAE